LLSASWAAAGAVIDAVTSSDNMKNDVAINR
jgi:hypothetical protein